MAEHEHRLDSARLAGSLLVRAIPLIAIAACNPGDPKPGEIVKPSGPGLTAIDPSGFVEQSLYEFVPGTQQTTGKRVLFRFPQTMVAPDAKSGARMRLRIKVPTTDGAEPAAEGITVLMYSSDLGGNIGARNISAFNYAFEGFGYPVENGLLLDPQSCDVDRFNATAFSSSQRSLLIAADETPHGLPADDTFVVGYPKGAEAYKAVGGCFQVHGNCALQSSYNGWPIYIGFKKTDACGVIDVIKRVDVVLDRFLVNETPRGAAYIDSRQRPITDLWRG